MNSTTIPDLIEINQAADRIRPYLHVTPVLTSNAINSIAGCSIFFKCENFQKAGVFKARGATNAVFSLNEKELSKGVATHSSGNHAAALSLAASLRKTKAYIVMPSNSNKVKIKAVENYGGIIRFCEPNLKSREETLDTVIKETGAHEIHPYNDVRIIAGQATAAKELFDQVDELDIIMSPVGGGGLLSGTALSARYFGPEKIKVIAAEPIGADDAYRSFYSKTLVPSVSPNTLADGLLTSLGSITYEIILKHVNAILTASDQQIVEAMRLVWERMKMIIEPSSAVPLAVILKNKKTFEGKKVGIIVSGGNVDLDNLPFSMSH
ncbi:MAG TPA: pyridoxal-phosphate dependent enzyme [Lentimicrobium sp.]|nr:pyridoxal-phosphate dependent enzyme [Lentimicrobium sp.]